MGNLPQRPAHVKWILDSLNPHTGKHAAYAAVDDALITIPIAVGTIDIFSLLYTPEEFDHPDAFLHETGFVCCFLDDQTVQIPLKDLPGFPLPRSVPADFQIAMTDFPRLVQFRDIGATDTLITLWRPAQPGEITGAHITRIYDGVSRREREKQSGQQPGGKPERTERKKPHLHVVPPREPEPKTASPELQLSLYKIPIPSLDWPLSLDLPFGACVLFLIIRHFPAPRTHTTGKLYSNTGAKQLTGYMTHYLPILLRHLPEDLKRQAKSLNITLSNVEYWHTLLRDAALVIPVSPPNPGVRTSRRLISPNEVERRQNLPLAQRVRANPRQPHKVLIP
ncbi:hypothetical protein ES703_41356 [subsurface metagenome]